MDTADQGGEAVIGAESRNSSSTRIKSNNFDIYSDFYG